MTYKVIIPIELEAEFYNNFSGFIHNGEITEEGKLELVVDRAYRFDAIMAVKQAEFDQVDDGTEEFEDSAFYQAAILQMEWL